MPAIVVAAAAAAAALPSGETTRLKHLQNRIIGNSTEKARLAANDAAVSEYALVWLGCAVAVSDTWL